MELDQRHFEALEKAEALMLRSDFCPYLDLKELFRDRSDLGRARCRSLFINFCRLGVGGLTEDFKKKFFEILFSEEVIVNGKPDFFNILNDLSGYERRNDDFAIPFSFVSKLVGMHCESSPIYDRHVVAFFHAKPPLPSAGKESRINWFIGFLAEVTKSYHDWANEERVKPVLERLKVFDSRLSKCHEVRLMDFLVWKTGKEKLLIS
ncbi:MAG: hypothetical protein ABSH52_27625 [Terriglobia bacterium]|jgi:hypothetical protein